MHDDLNKTSLGSENETEMPVELQISAEDEIDPKQKRRTLRERFTGLTVLSSFLAMFSGCYGEDTESIKALVKKTDDGVNNVLAEKNTVLSEQNKKMKELEAQLKNCNDKNAELEKQNDEEANPERAKEEADREALKTRILEALNKQFGTGIDKSLIKKILGESIFDSGSNRFYNHSYILERNLGKSSNFLKLISSPERDLEKVLAVINVLPEDMKENIAKDAISYAINIASALALYKKYEKILNHHPDYFDSKHENFRDWEDPCGNPALHDDYQQNVDVKQGVLIIKHMKAAGFSLEYIRSLIKKVGSAFGVKELGT